MTSSDGLYFQEEGGEMVLRGVEELDRHLLTHKRGGHGVCGGKSGLLTDKL